MLLALETSSPSGSVAICQEGKIVAEISFHSEHSHSRLLAPAVQDVLRMGGAEAKDLKAIAISAGPGSYTGLRIGASLAKGLCFATGAELIAVPTLQVMAAKVALWVSHAQPGAVLAPMLDARRMEAYTALYDCKLQTIKEPSPQILDEHFLADVAEEDTILLFGSGAEKSLPLLKGRAGVAYLPGIVPTAHQVGLLGWKRMELGLIESAALFEPDYLKPFMGKVA